MTIDESLLVDDEADEWRPPIEEPFTPEQEERGLTEEDMEVRLDDEDIGDNDIVVEGDDEENEDTVAGED